VRKVESKRFERNIRKIERREEDKIHDGLRK
jgi:hypothetical protein